MSIVNTFSLQSNRQIKINFDGGDLSSDAGLLLIKEFVSKLGIERLLNHLFKTNDPAVFRYHTDRDNLLQMIYMIMAGYFEDDASDELTNDPVFKAILGKSALASWSYVKKKYKLNVTNFPFFVIVNSLSLLRPFPSFSDIVPHIHLETNIHNDYEYGLYYRMFQYIQKLVYMHECS